jgi:serine/threonine protein kinase
MSEASDAHPRRGRPLRWVLLTELHPAGDLVTEIKRSGTFEESRALEMLYGILAALAHVHSRGLVHRDVKTENVLVASDGRAVLADFGIAARLSDEDAIKRRCGTPGYAAPEILLGKKCGPKIDVFGAGAIFYFMLSGTMPFDGRNQVEMVHKTVKCQVAFDAPAFAGVRDSVKEFISERMLARSPAKRPMAGKALVAAACLLRGCCDAPQVVLPSESNADVSSIHWTSARTGSEDQSPRLRPERTSFGRSDYSTSADTEARSEARSVCDPSLAWTSTDEAGVAESILEPPTEEDVAPVQLPGAGPNWARVKGLRVKGLLQQGAKKLPRLMPLVPSPAPSPVAGEEDDKESNEDRSKALDSRAGGSFVGEERRSVDFIRFPSFAERKSGLTPVERGSFSERGSVDTRTDTRGSFGERASYGERPSFGTSFRRLWQRPSFTKPRQESKDSFEERATLQEDAAFTALTPTSEDSGQDILTPVNVCARRSFNPFLGNRNGVLQDGLSRHSEPIPGRMRLGNRAVVPEDDDNLDAWMSEQDERPSWREGRFSTPGQASSDGSSPNSSVRFFQRFHRGAPRMSHDAAQGPVSMVSGSKSSSGSCHGPSSSSAPETWSDKLAA